jgi:hypothetical protein
MPVRSVSLQGRRVATAPDPRLRDIVGEHEVNVTVMKDVLEGGVERFRLRAGRAEAGRGPEKGRSVKVLRRQDSDANPAVAPWIDDIAPGASKR